MDDLSGWLSKVDRLEKENEELKRKLRNAIKSKSKYKRLYESVKPEAQRKRLYKNQKALNLISQREAGNIDITLKEISKQTGVKYGTLKHMAYQYRKNLIRL